MCSKTGRRSWAVLATAAPWLVVALWAGACGHKKPPVPPPRMIPATTSALEAHQRGMEAVLRFPHPTTTLRGAVLSGLAQVDVYQYTRELPADALELQREEIDEYEQRLEEYQQAMAERAAAAAAEGVETSEPEGAQEPGAPDVQPPPAAAEEPPTAPREPPAPPEAPPIEEEGAEAAPPGGETAAPSTETPEEAPRHPGPAPTLADLVQVDPRTFEDGAVLVRTLAGEELAAATLGADFLVRVPLAELPAEGATGYAFAVRTTSLEGLPSALSNLAGLVLLAPPPAPASLTIQALPHGVELAWTADADPPEGFNVYRRDAQSRAYGEAVASPVATARTHTDWGAVLESRYIYAVTAIAEVTPLVESALSVEREIYYQDRFAPAAPGQLAAFPDQGAVRLLWEPPTDTDVAGYVVYRRSEGGEPRALMEEPAPGLEYIDREAPAGSIQLYTVVAVDAHGNRSVASTEARVRVP